jgi:hypothetical protein
VTIANGDTIEASDILAIQATANAAVATIAGQTGPTVTQTQLWTGLLANLPMTLPETAGLPWNNGGVLAIS